MAHTKMQPMVYVSVTVGGDSQKVLQHIVSYKSTL